MARECDSDGILMSTAAWSKFCKYFDRTWLKTFPPQLWNIAPIQRDAVSRTNNPLERFNREMNASFPSVHPNLPDFVVALEKLARRYANLKYDIDIGRASAPHRLPILLPKAIDLPDIPEDMLRDSMDVTVHSNNAGGEISDSYRRINSRRVVVRSSETSDAVSLQDMECITEEISYYDEVDQN
ncbi:unnamed protein product [Phytophthora fragariaefolia]|uniref:Unnamed protein product n=1 Tax=Phytophthora fragariaefolia TaxID=1490495 RepID=A0A9W6UF68_9STRA|nr:unnamed protein product [Phytophthora fragariaefolia]